MIKYPSNVVLATLWMTGAVVSFSAMAVAGRELAGALSTFELMFYRSLIGIVIICAIGLQFKCFHEWRTSRLGLHLSRNLFHFAGQNLWFYAVTLIPLSQLFAIEFTTPIWIALLAPLFLGEKLTTWKVLAATLGFCGILIVAQPTSIGFGIGHLAAACATIGFTGSVMMTKSLSRTETVWCILFWLTLIQTGYGAIATLWDGEITIPNRVQTGWVILVGICGLVAHFSMAQALRLAPATLVAPMDFVRLPLIIFIGWLFYNEAIEVAVLAGALLIIIANAINLKFSNSVK